MKRAIVHIGMSRTGSTSFQTLLARLRPRLAEAGVCYPELAAPGSPPGADVSHFQLGEALDGRRPRAEKAAGLARLARALAQTEADTVLLSYEGFSVQKPGFGVPGILRDVLARGGFAMEVGVVVKPQPEQLTSAYVHRAQLVREARTFGGFCRRWERSGRFDYHARLEPWRAAADGRVVAVPMRDARSDAPLLVRLLDALGLSERIGPLMEPGDARYTTNRSSGPVVVEASRRLRALRAHRQVPGHSRVIGHFLDDLAWSHGIDAEGFRGRAAAEIARVEAFYAPSNARFAAAYWGQPWDRVIARAPERAPNELAGQPIPAESEARIAMLVARATEHFGFRPGPAWARMAADLAEAGADRFAHVTGYSRHRVP